MYDQSNGMNFLDLLTVFSVGLQVMGYSQNLKQATMDDLMKELQKQDREYLEKIIKNQEKILEQLAFSAD